MTGGGNSSIWVLICLFVKYDDVVLHKFSVGNLSRFVAFETFDDVAVVMIIYLCWVELVVGGYVLIPDVVIYMFNVVHVLG